MVLSIFDDVIQKALLVMIRRCALDDLGVKIAETLVRSWRVKVLSYSLTSVSVETRDRTGKALRTDVGQLPAS